MKKRSDIQIIICHSFAILFIKSSLEQYAGRIIYHNVTTDFGYSLQKNSLDINQESFISTYKSYLNDLEEIVNKEIDYIKTFNIELIISDISPVAFEVASYLSIPSIGISNFTWYSAYKNMLCESCLNPLKDMYHKMDYFYALGASKEKSWGRKETVSYGFFSRAVEEEEVKRIKKQLNPTGNRKIVFIPIGMKINLGNITKFSLWNLKDYVFIVSSNMKVKHPNVYVIPEHYLEVQNFVAASDLIISKPGWGTIGEALCNRTSIMLISRESFTEDNNTAGYLEKLNYCKTIKWDNLTQGETCDFTLTPPPYVRNELEDVVDGILSVLEKEKEVNRK